ncbi:hypothetical protein BDN67DRAFT_970278 [Paxillus ammoniavirescens]|nr:hypothetical protein BDN67DRAFT_970278 [Paxillus ammoniavirescens]
MVSNNSLLSHVMNVRRLVMGWAMLADLCRIWRLLPDVVPLLCLVLAVIRIIYFWHYDYVPACARPAHGLHC